MCLNGYSAGSGSIPIVYYTRELHTLQDLEDGQWFNSSFYDEVLNNYNNNKLVIIDFWCYDSTYKLSYIFVLTGGDPTAGELYFFCSEGRNYLSFTLLSDGSIYEYEFVGIESNDNKVASISSSSTDNQYPSAKLLYDQLALKANLASPTFTGTPKAPTAATSTNNTQIATTAFVHNVVNNVNEQLPTESTVAGWGFTKNTGTYSKPSGGIPATDLASAVQTSLGRADTALQSYTETDPIFLASAAHGISSTDISNWNSKQSAITISSSEPTSSQGSNGDIWIVV